MFSSIFTILIIERESRADGKVLYLGRVFHNLTSFILVIPKERETEITF